jgi:hypothetical protein
MNLRPLGNISKRLSTFLGRDTQPGPKPPISEKLPEKPSETSAQTNLSEGNLADPIYAALITRWGELPQPAPGDIATITSNLSIINSETIIGGVVPASFVAAYLDVYSNPIALASFATNPPSNDTNTTAILAARLLTNILNGQSLVKSFDMSNPTESTRIQAMLTALVADSNSGLVAADQTAILNMAMVPRHNAPVAIGGLGLPGNAVNAWDLFNAGRVVTINPDGSPGAVTTPGLIDYDDANAVELAAQQ